MIFNSYAEQREALDGMKIVSCGHIFADHAREIYRPTGRGDWLLFYVARESETFYLSTTVRAEAGSAIIFAPGECQHHVYEGDKTAEFYYVHFTCEELPRGLSLETSRIYSLTPVQRTSAIFEEIIDEALSKRPCYEQLCLSRLLHLLFLIERERRQVAPLKTRPGKGITYAIQHMNRYFDNNLTLADYASMCYMSKYHFLRCFKAATGTTPLEYRNNIRLNHARELLENSYTPIAEIGALLGYTSPAYFSDTFSRHVGMSPLEYRKRHMR